MSSYRRLIFASVSAVLAAAVDDELLAKNPCKSRSVRPPAPVEPRVRPWTAERVFAIRSALPKRYQAMVDIGERCGLRQGEILGLTEEHVRFDTGWLHIANQVKVVNGHLVFGPLKRGKERDVPLPRQVARVLREHAEEFPPVDVSLPWLKPDGPLVTKRLYFSLTGGGAVRRTDFNTRMWKAQGGRASPDGPRARNVRAAALLRVRLPRRWREHQGAQLVPRHGDPGFTLRVYTRLMPSSDGRARRAVDGLYEGPGSTSDGPEAAPAE
ncbi:tyrosine-type recombinase/integrase [Streptomyces pyxinae]|uniref:tyrosine-type recombinase/integrase n=1 Tax=Streptomyces pyxinae TaxID=2970734 RepID=UPI00286836B7|nr:tyrosine-type recombinase/integrase [Streptomyces sp. LP05-1]